MKKRILLFLCIMTSLCLTSCQNCHLTFGNTNNEKYTAVSSEVTTVYETAESIEITYIINVNTGKFHYTDCPSVEQMNDKNKQEYSGDRDYLDSIGYKPCKKCKP